MTIRKKKIFIDGEVLAAKHFSGIGHYTLAILRSLDDIGSPLFDISLLVYFKDVSKVRALGFKNIKVIPSLLPQRITNRLKIHKIQLPIDLLFGRGTYIFPNFTSWPVFSKKSHIVSFVYDLSYEKFPHYADPKNQEFLSKLTPIAISRSNIVATISENSKNEIDKYYKPKADIRIYYPAVDTKLYHKKSNSSSKKISRKYSLPLNYILFVGNIEPRKNLKRLLLAYECLPSSLTSRYPLVLIGAKGWQDSEISVHIKRLQKKGLSIVLPTSYVIDRDLPYIYSRARLFVYPSEYEGFGIPPLESMACETPVITSNNSALPEVVGEAGVMVNANSVDDISRAIQDVLSSPDLAERLSKRGLIQAKKFSWHKTARLLLDDIKELYD